MLSVVTDDKDQGARWAGESAARPKAEGLSTRAIAERLGVSVGTVSNDLKA